MQIRALQFFKTPMVFPLPDVTEQTQFITWNKEHKGKTGIPMNIRSIRVAEHKKKPNSLCELRKQSKEKLGTYNQKD